MSKSIQSGTRHVDDLQAHEFNREIYNTDARELIERIEEQGFEDTFGRLTIKPDGTILSGHRRWKAAQACGIEELPVEVVDPESEREERRLILLANEYREKTPAEKIREGEAWEELERVKAKARERQGGSAGGKGKETFPDPSTGQARDIEGVNARAEFDSILTQGRSACRVAWDEA